MCTEREWAPIDGNICRSLFVQELVALMFASVLLDRLLIETSA